MRDLQQPSGAKAQGRAAFLLVGQGLHRMQHEAAGDRGARWRVRRK
jgi:hypothetical protein